MLYLWSQIFRYFLEFSGNSLNVLNPLDLAALSILRRQLSILRRQLFVINLFESGYLCFFVTQFINDNTTTKCTKRYRCITFFSKKKTKNKVRIITPRLTT